MYGGDYWWAIAALAVAYAAVTLWAARKHAAKGLLAASVIGVACIALLGFLDWRRLDVKETPLLAYMLAAVIPTTAASLVPAVAPRLAYWIQLSLAAVLFIGGVVAALVLGVVLADVFPRAV